MNQRHQPPRELREDTNHKVNTSACTVELQDMAGQDYDDVLSVIESGGPSNANFTDVTVKGTTADNTFTKSELPGPTRGRHSGRNTFGTNIKELRQRRKNTLFYILLGVVLIVLVSLPVIIIIVRAEP